MKNSGKVEGKGKKMINKICIILFMCCIIYPICLNAKSHASDVLFLGPDYTPNNGDEFSINLIAKTDIPEMLTWSCKVVFNASLVTLTTRTGLMEIRHKNGIIDYTNAIVGMQAGDVLLQLDFKALNPGQDFFGVFGCTYRDMSGGGELPLNYDLIIPTVIQGYWTYYGNFDNDTDIDGEDLYMLVAVFPGTESSDTKTQTDLFDLNQDGKIDWQDLAVFASSFGADDIK